MCITIEETEIAELFLFTIKLKLWENVMTYSINVEHFLAINNKEISLYMKMMSVKFIVVM
jgi:hypothetical protein